MPNLTNKIMPDFSNGKKRGFFPHICIDNVDEKKIRPANERTNEKKKNQSIFIKFEIDNKMIRLHDTILHT